MKFDDAIEKFTPIFTKTGKVGVYDNRNNDYLKDEKGETVLFDSYSDSEMFISQIDREKYAELIVDAEERTI